MAIRTLTAAAALMLLTAAASAPITSTTVDPRIQIAETAVAAQLPDQLVFTDHMGTAQIAPLAAPLELQGPPASDYRAGDVAYWEHDHSVIVFLSDGAAVPAGGLIIIGRVTQGMSDLISSSRDSFVQIDRAAL